MKKVNINWNNIRAIEGQREGFEELVCQLAGQEKIENQVQFVRIGKPDGGKECYWELGNGEIHCWQAKYFTNSLTTGQWGQVNHSVKTAIDNHPNLVKYYVAIPVDRPDGKVRGTSMLQKWNDYVVEWENYALKKGMKVSFEYWGKHELETKLRSHKNEGLIYYFFDDTELTDGWFESKNQESLDALGGRYTPDLNFNLPFFHFHDGLTRDTNFSNHLNRYFETVLDNFRRVHLRSKKEELRAEEFVLNANIDAFRKSFEQINFSGIDNIPFQNIRDGLDRIFVVVEEISEKFQEWRRAEEIDKELDYYSRPYNNELHDLRKLSGSLNDFNNFLDSEVCQLANNPYLVLSGPAGIGKSHTIADIVEERSRMGRMSLLLLGENFSTNEMPWTQILRNQLRLDGNEKVFLGALNAKAQSQQERILVFIDALNEGNGRLVWPKRLKAFIHSFKEFPWLGLIVSIRDSYEKLIAPKKDIDDLIASRLIHPGFEGVEYEASNHFFKYYKIIPPGSPLLHPEFQNPLFLKLFCEGLFKKGLNQVPDGYQGITAIIDNFLEGVEKKLSQPDELDYDVRLKLLDKAVKEIILNMVDEESDHLSYEKGEEIVSSIFSGKCGSGDRQYLLRLISEGVINEDLYWQNNKHYDGIHFAYQRFQDHLLTSHLLDKYLDLQTPEKSFALGPLQKLLENESQAYYHQNVIEALSVQIPERVNRELYEVAPYAAEYYTTIKGFVEGLVWRRTDTIGEASLYYVNNVVLKRRSLFYEFLDRIVSMASKPNFYFNADKLHKVLFRQSLSKRDSWWTVWLQDKYGEHSGYNSVKRLINWAWSDHPKEEISNESARLAAVTLTWFFTSSNRYLRDAATKAMVNLLQNKLHVLQKVLQQFEVINDPYVYERLFAVAYGCALRTRDHKSLVPLSQYIYKIIFDQEKVFPHILLRDYARGVIEYSIHLKLEIPIELQMIRPPYKSDFPQKLPSIEEIDRKYQPEKNDGNYGEKKWGTTAILMSMTTEYGRGTARYGDFGRYTFQSALSNWEVDYDGLSNYGVQRIFELGYKPEIFSEFDSRQGSGRGGSHFERIGKKYQWIVFYEILARVSDNCRLLDEEKYLGSVLRKYTAFQGPWRPYVRDIDPTVLIKKSEGDNDLENMRKLPWWIPVDLKDWEFPLIQWKRRFQDFPKVEELITVTDAKGVEWLNLCVRPDWREPKKLGADRWNGDVKRIWYDISSCLVDVKQFRKMQNVRRNDGGRNWFLPISNRYEVFSREHLWSPASIFFQNNPYYGGDAFPTPLEDDSGEQIAMVHSTSHYYLWEEEFDCSKDATIGYYKPASLMGLGITPSENEGEYLNDQNEVVCFDPSINEKGPACLLIRKDHVIDMLEKSSLRLAWIVQGEKQILGNSENQGIDFSHKVTGLYHMDPKGMISGKLKNYIENYD
ncbi:hypothetical protein V6B16_03815 [Salinimicrobium catena]|uniref:hypothetical protein n=1 Tax=Salinimicrobium catena TaxID=390640 RepID=UPI002FE4CF37